MTTSIITRITAVLAASIGLGACSNFQDGNAPLCKGYLDQLHQELVATGLNPLVSQDKFAVSWSARAFPRHDDPGKVLTGKEGHSHTVAELEVMRKHFKVAKDLCERGEEHEATLHMDVVRALHKLPEIQHPQEHPTTTQTP